MMPQLSITNADALWLGVSAGFQRLDRKLLACLASQCSVAHWAYSQSPDEPCSLAGAIALMNDYIETCSQPLHLVGHSTGGLLGLLYARQFPHRVKSLTLLSVGVYPAIDWKACYYAALKQLPCSRTRVLAQIVYALFGYQPKRSLINWVEILERDLIQSLSLHSPLQQFSLFPGGAPVPLLVCGGSHDAIVDPEQIEAWRPWLKPSDRIWLCPEGRHFFQATRPQAVAQEILAFWQAAETPAEAGYLSR